MSKLSILGEFWAFCKVRKKYWMLPIVMIVLLLAFVIANSAVVLPFLYP